MKHLISLVGGAVLALACCVPATSAANTVVLFRSDFETGVLSDSSTESLSQGWSRMGTMPVITQEEVRVGKYSMKAYLNKDTSSTPYRTMLQSAWNLTSDLGNRSPSIHAPFFEDSWIGFSFYLPSKGPGSWILPSSTYEVLAQWHDAHDPFPPPSWDVEQSKNPLFSIMVSETSHPPARHWRLVYLGESRTPYPTLGSPRPYRYETNQSFDLGAIDSDLDKWTDWVVRIRWNFWKVGTSNNGANWDVPVRDNVAGSPNCGLIQVWKNGVLAINASPVQIGSNDNAGPVFSVGLYKGWRTASDRASDVVQDRLVYVDEFRYAGKNGSYADVAPGLIQAPDGTKKPKPPSSILIEAH